MLLAAGPLNDGLAFRAGGVQLGGRESGDRLSAAGRLLASPDERADLDASTQVNVGLPWAFATRRDARARLCLSLLWYEAEPERVGESACISRACTLGRGVGDGQLPRVEFVRQRPGSFEPRGSLKSPSLSRTQLRLTPEGDALHVDNVGRAQLLHEGVRKTSVLVRPGDVFTLNDVAVFLVELRSELWPGDAALASFGPFAFGEPDRLGLVGESPAMWQLRSEIAAAARAGVHVLIHGASGVGKELAARALHACSERAQRPFVSRNAATLPTGLIDAELFGNIKNYPNSGSPERLGLIGEADGGYLVLDEIGELPTSDQAHLLRALDEGGEYQRLGDAKVRRADLRVVAMTNRDPSELKHDLLARFPVRIRVPNLSERRSDLPLLMRAIASDLARRQPELASRVDGARLASGSWQPTSEPRLLELFSQHCFAGNHRELEQLLRIALTTSTDRYLAVTPRVLEALELAAAPAVHARPAARPAPDRAALVEALAAADGSASLAAQRLGLKNRHVLYRLLKKHGIELPKR